MVDPKYEDLYDCIPEFVKRGYDVRVFRTQQYHVVNGVKMFQIGITPELQLYPKDTVLTKDFLNNAIQKVIKKREFDHTVKPYPHRDLYYQIIIQDFRDLITLSDLWKTMNTAEENSIFGTIKKWWNTTYDNDSDSYSDSDNNDICFI